MSHKHLPKVPKLSEADMSLTLEREPYEKKLLKLQRKLAQIQQTYLLTGRSGVIVFEGPAQALALPVAQFLGGDVVFTDVGVGGSTTFDVSDPLHMSLGNFTQDPPDPYTSDDDYPRQSADLRLQLGPPGSAAPFISDFTLLGIAGMPAMAGRVSVIAPKLAAKRGKR